MKFNRGRRPANGRAIVAEVDEHNKFYTVRHYLTDASPAEIISRIPEGRLVTLQVVEVRQ